VESVWPRTFLKNSLPPKLNFTCLPLLIEHNFSIEEREAINRVGSVPSLFVGPTNLSWCSNTDKRDYI
jgi:2-keto-3-deoxy-L-rhamnonate aldolase RhmA